MLSGYGDGGEFNPLDRGLIAYDAEGQEVDEGIAGIEGDLEEEDYCFKGVQRVKWEAGWEKTNGELTGNESVTLTLRGNEDEGLIMTDTKTVVLDKDGDRILGRIVRGSSFR